MDGWFEDRNNLHSTSTCWMESLSLTTRSVWLNPSDLILITRFRAVRRGVYCCCGEGAVSNQRCCVLISPHAEIGQHHPELWKHWAQKYVRRSLRTLLEAAPQVLYHRVVFGDASCFVWESQSWGDSEHDACSVGKIQEGRCNWPQELAVWCECQQHDPHAH